MNSEMFLVIEVALKLLALLAWGAFILLTLVYVVARSQGCKPSRLKLHFHQGQLCITDLDCASKP